jgi:hypothetical protein
LPAVDDVADEVKIVGLVVPQKVEKIVGLAAGGAQMDVGDPDGAIPALPEGGNVVQIQDMSLVVMLMSMRPYGYVREVTGEEGSGCRALCGLSRRRSDRASALARLEFPFSLPVRTRRAVPMTSAA